jgi:hypothetical protein
MRLLKISETEFDTLTLKIECRNLGGYYPIAEVFLSVKSDLFAMRKKDCHLIFMICSIITFISFLFQWKTRLKKARTSILLLLLSIVAHESITDFGFPQILPVLITSASRLQRSLIRVFFAHTFELSPAFLGLSIIEFVIGISIDLLFLFQPSTPGWSGNMVLMFVFVEVMLFTSSCRRARLAFWSVFALSLNEAWLLYANRANEPANWFVLPMVLPELFVWGYVGLHLDFQDPTEFERI